VARLPRSQNWLTPQRQAVLDVLRTSTDHPTAAEIYGRVQATLPGIAYGTIYNALAALVERGEVTRWNYGDAATRYEGRTDAHSHAECLRCGRLVDVELPLPDTQLHDVAKATGFRITGSHTEFVGLCEDCARETKA